ncbi:MAG: mechanosensitive ion channel family protein [Suilimivivens sp.]|nr:mechanosensitive ion channel family protein [Lachnospiraceae bacterium]MDY5870821.1 mechanosensitive ion channel family protein [Lachnospiraceae bacterium]
MENEIDPGVIEKFLEELPEKAFHLGLRVVLAGLAFLMGVQLIRLIRKILKKTLERSKADISAMNFIDSFVKFALYFLLVLTIASGLGVDAASILAIVGSAGVAIGLALQGSLSNLAGGVLILVLKPFRVGDYIEDSNNRAGIVESIDIFYTHLLTYDNIAIVLPNGTLANGTITNYTQSELRRVIVPVSISYQADVKEARKVLLEALKEDPSVRKDKEMRVLVDALADSGVNLLVRCWVKQDDYWETKWRLTELVKDTLDEAGISIPFPQLDVHINRSE